MLCALRVVQQRIAIPSGAERHQSTVLATSLRLKNETELKHIFDVKEKRRRANKKRRSAKIDLDELYRWMADDMMDAIIRAIKNAPQPAPFLSSGAAKRSISIENWRVNLTARD